MSLKAVCKQSYTQPVEKTVKNISYTKFNGDIFAVEFSLSKIRFINQKLQ